MLLAPNSSIDVDVGDTLAFACVSFGENESTNILWKFGDRKLANNSKIRIYDNPQLEVNGINFTLSVLELCSVQLGAPGLYSCTAKNSMDQVSFNFTLTVQVRDYY